MFRPTSASQKPPVVPTTMQPGILRGHHKVETNDSVNNNSSRVHSAKGRLERQTSYHNSSQRPFSSTSSSSSLSISSNKINSKQIPLSYEKSPSVIDLNSTVSVPDKDDEMLARQALLIQREIEQYHNPVMRMRPSSAKSDWSNFSLTEDNDTYAEEKSDIKPSVHGLKFGRHVFGNEPELQEAWANTEKDFPFKLNSEENKRRLELSSTHDDGHITGRYTHTFCIENVIE